MSELINSYDSEFNDAVTEYKLKQKEILQDFLVGCVQLGSILQKYRDGMKKINKWMEYCKEIDITVVQANQYIRLYEYSETMSDKQLLGKVITNWAKANLFLSLKEDEKGQVLLMEGANPDISSSEEFRERIGALKEAGEIPDLEDTDENALWKQLEATVEDQENPALTNAKYAAEMLQKRAGFTVGTRPFLEVALHLVNAKNTLEKLQKRKSALAGTEKEDIFSSIEDSINDIATLLDTF